MSFELPPLPYALNALEPHLSKETLEYHHGKHHKTYVDNLNKLTDGKPETHWSLEKLILESTGALFNNAAQIWNHTFYWDCLNPHGGGEPTGDLAKAIIKNFGSFTAFKEKFSAAAVGTFGSGWAWLVSNAHGDLEIMSTSNADNPMKHAKTPLMTCDVWEHAYYIDYRNARAKYVDSFWNLVNWKFVAERFGEI